MEFVGDFRKAMGGVLECFFDFGNGLLPNDLGGCFRKILLTQVVELHPADL